MSSDTEPLALSGTASNATTTTAHALIDMDTTNEDADILHNSVEVPSTPLGADLGIGAEMAIPASQETILSTEGPGSPMDAEGLFRTELNDDDDIDIDTELPRSVVPSSLTPPPSSQVRQSLPSSQRHLPLSLPSQTQPSSCYTLAGNGYTSVSQHSAIPSPPGSSLSAVAQARREAAAFTSSVSTEAVATIANTDSSQLHHDASKFIPPTPMQIVDASPDELRAMLQACLIEHTRLKTEAAHHKLQYNLVTMQADEDAKRAAVEYEMTRREMEALCAADNARQARRELSTTTATETSQAKYRQLKAWYDEAAEENESLQKRVKLAKRVIQQKEEEVAGLVDEKELLLNRLRENREHFHLLCSPGGLFHGVMTPKPQDSTAYSRTTSYQTPKRGSGAGGKLDSVQGVSTTNAAVNHNSAEPFAALLRALNQEDTSAPNTPLNSLRAPQRHVAKHARNAQSMSSLPTTPTSRARGNGNDYAGLLPSVDLVPQTEPPPLRFAASDSRHSHNGHQRRSHGHSHSVSHTTSASGRYFPETPTRPRHRLPGGRHSRESTISLDDESMPRVHDGNASGPFANTLTENEDIARQALESVARSGGLASANSATQALPPPHFSLSNPAPSRQPLEQSVTSISNMDEHLDESQAGLAALAMLRRGVSSSSEEAGALDASRDMTRASPTASSNTADMAARLQAKLQAKLIGGLSKAGAVDKRKFSGGESQASHSNSGHSVDGQKHDNHHSQASPTKKVRIVPSLRDKDDSYRQYHRNYQQQHQDQDRIGLGIRYD
ncbi:hypothetical protein SEPCBS57363_001087 [Sporothrix epigloea]|uniref:FAD-dependent oxidoreductase-like enzyme n=1 Tax=Sporothrix epigloea TaxID=1892477 RepID=A0ABP0D8B2_9PEZI